MKLLILGGSGFVGRAVCKEAIQRGLWDQIVSLSRHGRPANVKADSQLASIEWASGDASDATLPIYSCLHEYSAIIHCVGTLIEQPKDQKTYERLNRDTLFAVLSKIPPNHRINIVYVSADQFSGIGPFLLPAYYRTKVEAENALLEKAKIFLSLNALILRPSLIYGSDRWPTFIAAGIFRLATIFSAGYITGPISVKTVARMALDGAAHGLKQ